jgi:DNA repair protein RecN (Recombination protein N)
MLQELSIKNFAIIDDIQITFEDGLTILSGETGAGKSIIINAVNLLLGSRATAKMIRTGAETAELQALFQVRPDSTVAAIMAEHGYTVEEGLLIRRIIAQNDRHRIYINGQLATIQILSTITANLASISGQHAHQLLLKEDQQLLMLDQYGGLLALREQVNQTYHEILPLVKSLSDLKALENRQTEHMELLRFQQLEILGANLLPNEDTLLSQELKRLKNAEALLQAVHSSIDQLYTAPQAVIETLVEIRKRLESAGRLDPTLNTKVPILNETIFQLEDLVNELRTYEDSIQMDSERLEEAEARLDALNRLKRKYGGSLEGVQQHLATIDAELDGVENVAKRIQAAEKDLGRLHERLSGQVAELSRQRAHTARLLAEKVETELATLKMPQTKFEIVLAHSAADSQSNPYLVWQNRIVSATGIDQATFLIAPNVGEQPKPLAGIASGGELSRVVLALKAILAKTETVATVIFDEVDAGIGGGAAEVVGKKLAALAGFHQVVCITHLPQIAKFGNHHYRISKRVSKGRTATEIKPLSASERVQEMARMLGGEKITQTTIDHAHEMLRENTR